MHDCQLEAMKEPLIYGDMYLVRCVCHDGSKYQLMRDTDFPFTCKVSGDVLRNGEAGNQPKSSNRKES